MPEPIELSESDLIRRPLELATNGTGAEPGKSPLSWMKGIKDNLKEVKELMDTLKELGINLPALGNIAKPASQPDQGGQMPQVQFFLQAIKAQYGDLTIKQLMAVLLDKYGDKKLGDLIK